MPTPKKESRKKESRFVDFKAVKAAVTMEQALAHYGLLNSLTRGKDKNNLSGICPIHQGKNPTEFRVSLSKNCWNCFSACHCGGNVLDFVAKMEGVDLIEAAHLLIEWFKLDRAALCGEPSSTSTGYREEATLPTREAPASSSVSPAPPPADKPEVGVNKPLRFQLDLDDNHPYLAERGLTPDTVEEFGLGFCAKGVMSDRIAFPIHNAKGEVVGYAGRWPGEPPDGRPKYRLPDGFKKSVEVYRLAHAIHEPDGHPLVIVEGFFDVMRLWQLGVRKCVALMGSDLSEAQEALLTQHLKPGSQVIVMLDEDKAGRLGRENVLQRLARKVFVRVITFEREGFQPEHLTAELLKELGLIAS